MHTLERDQYYSIQVYMKSANFKITFTLTSLLLYHQTALHIAAREGQEVTVKHLVKKGADITIKDDNGVGI